MCKTFYLVFVMFVFVVNSFGCGEQPLPNCNDCVLSSDCESGTCTCVYNRQTNQRYCWACVPEIYDPLRGANQDLMFVCEYVAN